MPVSIEHSQDQHIVKLSGSFDVALAQTARDEFNKLLDNVHHSVILDLHDVNFIDSSGIGSIVFLYKRLRCKNLDLTIHGLQKQPKELIELLRIDKIIRIEP